MQNCCEGCENRHLGCHATCEEYKIFKEEIDNINKERRLYKLERTIIHSYSRPGWGSGIRRARKRKQAGAVDG